MSQPREMFRLPLNSPLVGVLVLFYCALAVAAWPHLDLVAMVFLKLVVVLLIMVSLSTLTINDAGMVLYRINKLKWEEVVAAKKVSVLGLPYVRLKKRKGMDWWVPLYFKGKRPLGVALLDRAPTGNPVRAWES